MQRCERRQPSKVYLVEHLGTPPIHTARFQGPSRSAPVDRGLSITLHAAMIAEKTGSDLHACRRAAETLRPGTGIRHR